MTEPARRPDSRRRACAAAPAALPRGRSPAAARAWLDEAQSGAAAGGGADRGAAAGARRRRHRQDAGADRPHRPYPRHRPRLPLADPRRHLHQQGGARDEEPRRRADRRRPRRGHAVARHVPFDRREDPAPPCRAGRAPLRLHHPRHRRPGAAAEADRHRRQHRREALAGAPARRRHRRLEEPRPVAGQGAGRRGLCLRQRQGPRALRRVPGSG